MCASSSSAQDAPGNSWFVRTGFATPYILPSTPFSPSATGETVNVVPDLTIELGRQTNGTRPWHHLYGLPAYGVGVSLAHYQNGTEHGQPREAYLFFSWPFADISPRIALTTDFAMGLSWNWQRMDPATNTPTPVLGSNMNALIDWGLYVRYRSTPRMSIYTGLDFTHRSNAGIVQPDKGINVIGPKVGVQYDFGRARPPSPQGGPLPRFLPEWDLLIGGSGGLKNVVENSSPMLRQDFGVAHVTAAFQRHLYRFGRLNAGTDLTYDGATGAKAEFANGAMTLYRAEVGQRLALGLYGGYEHVIGRFSPFVDVGYNVARSAGTDPDTPRLYQRFGWRYNVSDRVWGTVAVRSVEGRKAESLEVGVGYRFNLTGGRRGSAGTISDGSSGAGTTTEGN